MRNVIFCAAKPAAAATSPQSILSKFSLIIAFVIYDTYF